MALVSQALTAAGRRVLAVGAWGGVTTPRWAAAGAGSTTAGAAGLATRASRPRPSESVEVLAEELYEG